MGTKITESQICIVAAVASNRVIGNKGQNKLLWYLKEDLKHFRKLTIGCPLVMGRATFDTFLDGQLDGRTHFVVSHDPGARQLKGAVKWYRTLDLALSGADEYALKSEKPIMVIGGASIYEQTMPLASQLCITHISHEYIGDALFPDIDPAVWTRVSVRNFLSENPRFLIATYQRKAGR
jgi:dihydrofolate reductase